MLHPTKYAAMLAEKMQKHGATGWLVNTGWSGGRYWFYTVYSKVPWPYWILLLRLLSEHELGPKNWLMLSRCSYGSGSRIKLPYTRKIIDAIHSGSLLNAEYKKTEVFGLEIPTAIEGVPSEILDPVNTVSHSAMNFYEVSSFPLCMMDFPWPKKHEYLFLFSKLKEMEETGCGSSFEIEQILLAFSWELPKVGVFSLLSLLAVGR